MKKTKTIYWIFTGIFAALMLASAIPEILSIPAATKYTGQLGYPQYLNPFLGVAKLLGVLAILVPGFPKIKEWAYAGFAFDLLGATYSQIAIGIPVSQWIFMFIWIILLIVSYVFYHKKLSDNLSGN